MTQDSAGFQAVDNPSIADLASLEGCLDAFNASATGIADGRLLTILLKAGVPIDKIGDSTSPLEV